MPYKVGEIIKLMEADGWFIARTRGSHRQYRHPTKRGKVTVAGKPSETLRPGTEASILRNTGLERRPS
jgi:predicted RNA binding protein YcfA (HicA-like mRNA interferase family)